jgi:hypothetical protein
MNPIVPASTKIRPSRVGNMETERLLRRQAFLVAMADDGFRDCGQRRQFVDKARELRSVENELDLRSVAYQRRTLTDEVCRQLSTHRA